MHDLSWTLRRAEGLYYFQNPEKAISLIHIFCGTSFEPAILTLQIVAPRILFVALSNLIGIQILFPQGQENKVIISTTVGAVFNLLINSFLWYKIVNTICLLQKLPLPLRPKRNLIPL